MQQNAVSFRAHPHRRRDCPGPAGARIRELVQQAPLPAPLADAIRTAYEDLAGSQPAGAEVSWAARSSATAEYLPDTSFAGQQETFLDVRGVEIVLVAVKDVFASVQRPGDRLPGPPRVRARRGRALGRSPAHGALRRRGLGVVFTMDTESGFTDAVFLTSSCGLGEAVVQGR